MKKERRKKEVKLRKKFSLTVFVTILLWLILTVIIFLTDPEEFGMLPLFFTISFLALIFTFSIIFINTRRGLIFALLGVIFLFLRYLGVGNILNLLLLSGVGVSIDYYLNKNK